MLTDPKQLARSQREHGEHEAAARTLLDAVAAETDPDELAELYGMLGGTRRDAGDLVAAIAAYDAGAGHESADSTYNELNRLVTRIMLEPACLTGTGITRPDVAPADVPGGLARVRARLQHRADAGDADAWALGDLAVACALSGDAAGMSAALDRLAAAAPDPSVPARYRETFGALARLDTPRRQVLADARERLQHRP
jgi:hypothetical protein